MELISESAKGLVLVGPTASGKTALAMSVARARPGTEIVSVDSMSVYRGMDIGTSKPTASERAEVPHHLLDLADPSEEFSVGRFKVEAGAVLAGIVSRRGLPVLVGGTGLYVRAVVDDLSIPGRWGDTARELEVEAERPGGAARLYSRLSVLDPVAATRLEPSNRRRVVRALEVTIGSGRPFSSFGPGLGEYGPTSFRIVGLDRATEELDRRIEERFQRQLDSGLLEEVRALAGRSLSRTARHAIGYGELLRYLDGDLSLEQATASAVRRTKRLARRQRAWFARDPRVEWVEPGSFEPTLLGDLEACPC